MQYASAFRSYDECLKIKEHQSGGSVEDREFRRLKEDVATRSSIDWKEAFKRGYIGIKTLNPLKHALAGFFFPLFFSILDTTSLDDKSLKGNHQYG